MRPELREYLDEAATGAARSKDIKAKRRRKGRARFTAHLAEKAERMEANGNPRAAAAFRSFWRKLGYLPPEAT